MMEKENLTEAAPVDMQLVGRRFRSLRKHMGLTQKEAAALAQTTAKHISEAERGACGISLQVLARLCRIYEVPADYILFGQTASREETDWISSQYDRLSPDKKRLFEQMVHSLLEGLQDPDS